LLRRTLLHRMFTVAALVLFAVAARPAWGMGFGICTPDSARQAYDELVAAAPDGSEVENHARAIADQARARGTFDSDETIEQLDELARSADYRWDCEAQVYRYQAPMGDPSGEDEPADTDSTQTDLGDTGPTSDGGDGSTPPETFAEEPTTFDETVPPSDAGLIEPGAGQSEERPGRARLDADRAASPSNGPPGVPNGSGAERDGADDAAPGAPPTQSAAAGVSVTPKPGGHDGRGGVLRWIVGGGLLATVAAVAMRRRR
jgi:hypothetical protein